MRRVPVRCPKKCDEKYGEKIGERRRGGVDLLAKRHEQRGDYGDTQ